MRSADKEKSIFKNDIISESNLALLIFAVCMFCTGASGYVCEVLLSTVSSYILGNTVVQFSVVVGLMMVAMGLSQLVQVLIGKERLVEKYIAVELILSLLCGFTPLIVYCAFAFVGPHFKLIQISLACSIGFLIGFEIPIVLRINEKYADSLPVNISRTVTWDYIGVAFGLGLWYFLLKKNVLITEISFIVGAINLFVALFALFFFIRYGLLKNKYLWFFLSGLTIAGMVAGLVYNRDISFLAKQRLYEDKIIVDEQTLYQNIVVTHREDIDDYRLYCNGQLQASSSDEIRYHEPLVHPVMSLVPWAGKKVLVLGGGDGMALRELLKYNDLKSITLVELDPEMISLFTDNPVLSKLNDHAFSDPRVNILKAGAVSAGNITPVYMDSDKLDKKGEPVPEVSAYSRIMTIDADIYIGAVTEKYDVVIIDFPDPGSVELAKLYSQEFYLKLKRVMSENGMFVIQATSPYHAKEAFLGINRTIKSAGFNTLPYRNNVPSFGDWGWILAWKDHIPEKVIINKIETMEFNVETDYLTADQAKTFFKNWGKGELESKYKWINSYMNPALLWAYLDECWKID
ncbi:MAG: polyamine aminopropyltransferase [Desulfobacteraceae bacterium]|jgi:spermidine synthase